MNEKVVTTIISASAGVISTALIGFFTTTAFCGQWWVTPKHKAKALSKLNESLTKNGITDEDIREHEQNIVLNDGKSEEK